MLNKILSIHAKWLKDNGYEYKQCLKEAKTFKDHLKFKGEGCGHKKPKDGGKKD